MRRLLAAAGAVTILASLAVTGAHADAAGVRLTREILRTSQAQLSDSRALLEASLEVSRGHLRAILAKIGTVVEPLDPARIPVEHLRRSGIWGMGDEDQILRLAPAIGRSTVETAGRLVASLSWLRQLQERISRSNPTHGYGVDQKEALLYHQHRAAAERELHALQAAIP